MGTPAQEALSKAEWDQMAQAVAVAMFEHVPRFITPVGRVIDDSYGKLEGSGSYIEYGGKRFLVTNEHVASAMTQNSMSHMMHGCTNMYRVRNGFITKNIPQDIAASWIDDKVWNHDYHAANAIPESYLAEKHAPVDSELFFMCGFAGENTAFYFGHFLTRYTPYLTQEPQPRLGLHPYHFAILYNPERAQTIDGGPGLPNPHGFSGSLIWNTRRTEFLHLKNQWSPEMAQVTGIVHTWDDKRSCLLGTRIEELTKFLRDDVPKCL